MRGRDEAVDAAEDARGSGTGLRGAARIRERVVCPRCSTVLVRGDWSATAVVCGRCAARYPRYGEILDLRLTPHSSCWTDTLTCDEQSLVERLVRADADPDLTLEDLIRIYSEAHRPLPNLAMDDRGYMSNAEKREYWTVKFMEDAVVRYAPATGHDFALDAGCGSGGALRHLAARYAAVAGIDPDLPSLVIAARRCRDAGLEDRTLLLAAMLEHRVFASGTFDAVKCTDVVEHVASPSRSAVGMAAATRTGGAIYLLTPNKWNLLAREPHVKLWGVQVLPQSLADAYCRRRIGIPYSNVSRLLSYRQLMNVARDGTDSYVSAIPIEDKHLNPASGRGRVLKGWFERAPMRWVSRAIRPVQPVLELVMSPQGSFHP